MTSRTTSWMAGLLALLCALPPLFSFDVISRCLVTGATSSQHERCCYVPDEPCCAAEFGSGDASAAADTCDCCETVLRRHVPDTPSHPATDGSATAVAPPPAAPAVAPPAPDARDVRPPAPTRWARAGPGRHLLHCSFRL